LETARLYWQQLSTAYQQLNFTLTQIQQENDRLRARRFQLEIEKGDRFQRIVDLEAEVTTLQEDAYANDIERLTLL
jgi:cell division protein FtsB